MIRTPPFLRPGDLIGFVATARFLETERIEEARKLFVAAGFRVRVDEYADRPFHQFGGDDAARSGAFNRMLADEEIKAVFSVRGGYGSVRMVDGIDDALLKATPKWICGYSDITILHGRAQQLNIQSLHCPMPVDLPSCSPEAREQTFRALKGENIDQEWAGSENDLIGSAEGILKGGNLSVLYSLLGSADLPDMQGAVLFIEEIDEYLYHIDRMLRGMSRSGLFAGLKGVVIGGLTDMNDHDRPFGWTAEQIIRDQFAPLNIPVAFGLPAGHIRDNRPLLLGGKVRLEHECGHWKLSYH